MEKKQAPTPRQRKAALAVVENLASDKPVSVASILRDVGYGTGLQDQPARVLKSVGFKDALREMGLTEELITSSLVSDIENKPKARLGELKLGAEILGMVKREDDTPKENTGNTYNFLFSAETQEKVKMIEDSIKAQLINPHAEPDT